MEWEQIFTLVDISGAFHKMVFKMRKRNVKISAEMNDYWKIMDRFPYLENITILNDFSTDFCEKLGRFGCIGKLRIIGDGRNINYINCNTLIELDVCEPLPIYENVSIDYLINILKINRNINKLIYGSAMQSNESIYYLTRNKIFNLKLMNVHTEQLSTLPKYLEQNMSLKRLTVAVLETESIQNAIFMDRTIDMNHITKLPVHILDTIEVNYTLIKIYQGLKTLKLYFNYSNHTKSNILKILEIIKYAKFLRRIRIYHIGSVCEPNEELHEQFHDEINLYIEYFRNRGIDIFTCSKLYTR